MGFEVSVERVLEFVRADAMAGRFDAWGLSTVIDEHVGEAVIGREVFDLLHEAAGIEADFPVGNAGVLHVYGYWFSKTPTPFGLKRDRWQNGVLAAALGRRPEEFRLDGAADSTPLERVTRAVLPLLLEPPAGAVAAEVRLGGSSGDDCSARVVLHRSSGASVWALVYGVALKGAEWRLITVFPFQGAAEELVEEFEANPGFRWNAVDFTDS